MQRRLDAARATGAPSTPATPPTPGIAGALDGVRVLDLTGGIAGPLAAMLLADLGADVVKVVAAPTAVPAADPAARMWDRNKRLLVLEPACPADAARLVGLVQRADVVLVGSGGGASLERLLELGCRAGEPARWIALPAYLLGSTPWAGGEESPALLFAWLGHAWNQASYDDVPVDCLFPLAALMQGVWAATLAVALLAGERLGRRSAAFAVAGGAHGGLLVSPGVFAAARDEPHVHRPGGPGGSLPNYRCYRCGDGEWIFFGAFTTAFIRRGFAALGAEALIDDERLGGDLAAMRLPEHYGWLSTALEEVFASRPRADWLAALEAADVPAGAVLASEAWLDHEQIAAMGLRAELTDEAGTTVVMPGALFGLSETPPTVRAAAPTSPSAYDEVLGGWSERAGRRMEDDGPSAQPPLAGVRVLDLGTIIAGPYIATLLGELGAEVVKVERPPAGDEFRVAHGGRGGVGFPAYNRRQRSAMIDLARPGGAAAFVQLVRAADVVVENYRPGVVERLGIDHSALSRLNPAVTTVSVSAFGGVGPLGERPALDPVVQAMSGIMRSQGGRDGDDSPVFLAVPANDVLAAGLGALGACASLYTRDLIGRGQRVSVTLCASACLLQAELLVEYPGRPERPAGGRDFAGRGPLDRLYQAADGWVRLAARLPDARSELVSAGLLPSGEGAASPAELSSAIAGQLRRLPVAEVLRRCAAQGLPAVKARQSRELVADDDLVEHGLLAVLERDGRGATRVVPGRFVELAGHRPPPGDAPRAGEHTVAVLLGAGMSPEEVEQLLRTGAAVDPGAAVGADATPVAATDGGAHPDAAAPEDR